MVKSSDIFYGAYKGKKVLVTGHTGFKGSWLAMWLLKLGAKVGGFSLYLPSKPCNFEAVKLAEKICHYEGDVRDSEALSKVFKALKPEIVFHLAAQSIVRKSYDIPKTTFDTNLSGTVNILECIKRHPFVKAAVIITSDKCYDNVEWEWGYRENDRLGGDDPYSASKACAEIACRAYLRSFFALPSKARIATARAGNVIGGGDWAQDRIVPDCIRAWSKGGVALVRNLISTRPWQHVLEPLSGYLLLGANLIKDPKNTAGEAFNFGPNSKVFQSVQELVELLLEFWGKGSWEYAPLIKAKKESTLLKLCCDKALHLLGWHATLDFNDTVKLTAEWYKNYYSKQKDVYNFSYSQIDYYVDRARKEGLAWAGGKSKND